MPMKRVVFLTMVMSVSTAFIVPENFLHRENSPGDTTGYVLVKEYRDIKLYEKWDSIDSHELAREVKAVFTVKTEPGLAASFLRDESKGMQWNKNTLAYKVLEGDQKWICYIQYDLPWPVHNQDCVLQYTPYYVSDSLTITFKSAAHSLFPVRDNIDRIHDISGKWVMTKISEGIRVEYFITTIPSKTLPRWVTDPIIRNNLLNTLVEFRTLLESQKSKY